MLSIYDLDFGAAFRIWKNSNNVVNYLSSTSRISKVWLFTSPTDTLLRAHALPTSLWINYALPFHFSPLGSAIHTGNTFLFFHFLPFHRWPRATLLVPSFMFSCICLFLTSRWWQSFRISETAVRLFIVYNFIFALVTLSIRIISLF